MAGSLAPKGSYGLPSPELKAKNAAAWRAQPLWKKVLTISSILTMWALVALAAWALLDHRKALALVALGVLAVIVLVTPFVEIRRTRRASTKR